MKLSENVRCMCAISLSLFPTLSLNLPLFLFLCVCVHCSWLPAQRRQWQHKEVRKEAKHLLTSVQVCVCLCWWVGKQASLCWCVCVCVSICALSNGTSAWRLAAFRRQLWGALFLTASATTATHTHWHTHTHTHTKKKKRKRSKKKQKQLKQSKRQRQQVEIGKIPHAPYAIERNFKNEFSIWNTQSAKEEAEEGTQGKMKERGKKTSKLLNKYVQKCNRCLPREGVLWRWSMETN